MERLQMGRSRKYNKRRKSWERISGNGSESTGWALIYVLKLSEYL
jgi:hypothetical protein